MKLMPAPCFARHAALAVVALVAVFVGGQSVVVAQSGTITLHAEARTTAAVILLSDVAELTPTLAESLGRLEVGRFNDEQTQARVSMASVRQVLTQTNVNWGRVSLGGFAECRVVRITPQPEMTPEPALREERRTGADRAIAANPADQMDLNSPVSVRDHILERIARQVGVERRDLRVEFTRGDLAEMDRIADARFEFEPLSSTGLGRVPMVIRVWRDGEPVRIHRITAQVSHRILAVVLVRDLSRGERIGPRDVEIREVYVDTGTSQPLTALTDAVGQMVVTTVRADTMLEARYLQSPLLVRRGQMITVRATAGSLVLKLTVRAMEDGAQDDLVRVRNEQSREEFIVRVTGMRLAVTDHSGNLTTATNTTTGTEQHGGSS